MLNYKLALQLKKAGFPQDEFPCEVLIEEDGGKMCKVSAPSLERLMEACGYILVGNCIPNKKYKKIFWNASGWNKKDEYVEVDGETSLIAVAKLYLELNGK